MKRNHNAEIRIIQKLMNVAAEEMTIMDIIEFTGISRYRCSIILTLLEEDNAVIRRQVSIGTNLRYLYKKNTIN